jgi:hypothetical protein
VSLKQNGLILAIEAQRQHLTTRQCARSAQEPVRGQGNSLGQLRYRRLFERRSLLGIIEETFLVIRIEVDFKRQPELPPLGARTSYTFVTSSP